MGTRYVPGTHSLYGAQSDHDIGHNETFCDECDETVDARDLTRYHDLDLCFVCLSVVAGHDFQHIAGRGVACTKCGLAWDKRAPVYCPGE